MAQLCWNMQLTMLKYHIAYFKTKSVVTAACLITLNQQKLLERLTSWTWQVDEAGAKGPQQASHVLPGTWYTTSVIRGTFHSVTVKGKKVGTWCVAEVVLCAVQQLRTVWVHTVIHKAHAAVKQITDVATTALTRGATRRKRIVGSYDCCSLCSCVPMEMPCKQLFKSDIFRWILISSGRIQNSRRQVIMLHLQT